MKKLLLLMIFIIFQIASYAENYIRSTSGGIELRNELVSIIISEKAELVSCRSLLTNQDIADGNHNIIAFVETGLGKTISASKAELNGSDLYLTIGDITIVLEIKAYNQYFTIELKNEDLENVDNLTFIDLKLQYSFESIHSFLATGVAMSLHTDHCFYPTGESKEVVGRCTSLIGLKGAKIAIIACEKAVLRSILKEVYSSIPKGEMPISNSGGPFALDNSIVKKDCLMPKEVDSLNLHSYIETFSKYGVEQFDICFDTKAFIQGQFTFPKSGSAEKFKKTISDPLQKAGIDPTMHTYSFYISYNSIDILSNPHWQKQLEFREEFILSDDMSLTDNEIKVFRHENDLIYIHNNPNLNKTRTPFILIDNEIVKYSVDNNGKLEIQRGQCGTKASRHSSGTKVKVIGGYLLI